MSVETFTPQSLFLTDAALCQRGNVVSVNQPYLRLALKGGGCSGFEFFFELSAEDALTEEDTVVEGFVLDPVTMSYLKGSTIDYVVDLTGSMFKISSPLSTGTCGCGASLSF